MNTNEIIATLGDDLDNPLVKDIINKLEAFKNAQARLKDYKSGHLNRVKRQRAAKMEEELKLLAHLVADALKAYEESDDNTN